MSKKYLVWFEEINKEDVSLVGGKGANLGEMINSGFPVPYGFIVTANAYYYFIEHNKLAKKIKDQLSIANFENPKELTKASKAIKKLILQSDIPADLIKKIIEYYKNLNAHEAKVYKKKHKMRQIMQEVKDIYSSPLLAIRSSATAEDLPTASFAGQQETFLNVKGENHLIQKVRECWASLFTERAIYYRHQQKFDHFKIGLAAVIQRMVNSDKSGIAFSIDPVTNNKLTLTIEAIFGLGEYIVQGKVTPDHYEVDKKSLTIIKKDIKRQTFKYIKKGTSNIEVKLTKSQGEKEKLKDDEILKIAKLVKNIEKHYYFPQDIEWAIKDDQIYIVQSRPITTVGNQNNAGTTRLLSLQNLGRNLLLLKGDPASPGINYGEVTIIKSPKEIGKIKEGDILVAPQTNPDYVPAMKKARAIVTETGGRTSHAAIVSRELGIPAVVSAVSAMAILKREKIITVNGSTGEIFRGNILGKQESNYVGNKNFCSLPDKKIKTVTKIYVNLAEPENAEKIAKLNVDGVGLLRAEFMIAQMGKHPKEFIKEKKEHIFIDKLADNLLIFAKAFSPRPIIYRADDFKTNEYRNLKGGELYEPKEENPLIGFRGASRYIADSQVFNMELSAIKKVRSAGFKNIHLMIPFIRTPQELIKIKNILAEQKLANLPSFKLWIMVEVPSTVILLEEFIKIGIDGVSVGTNDLTMLILGVDRDNHEISWLYDEKNPAVLWALEKIVKTTQKYGITCSICGQAPSDYPEIVEKLVKLGIDSLSVNPDAISKTRLQTAEIEKKIWQKSKK